MNLVNFKMNYWLAVSTFDFEITSDLWIPFFLYMLNLLNPRGASVTSSPSHHSSSSSSTKLFSKLNRIKMEMKRSERHRRSNLLKHCEVKEITIWSLFTYDSQNVKLWWLVTTKCFIFYISNYYRWWPYHWNIVALLKTTTCNVVTKVPYTGKGRRSQFYII